jgi:hypothetical protein
MSEDATMGIDNDRVTTSSVCVCACLSVCLYVCVHACVRTCAVRVCERVCVCARVRMYAPHGRTDDNVKGVFILLFLVGRLPGQTAFDTHTPLV